MNAHGRYCAECGELGAKLKTNMSLRTRLMGTSALAAAGTVFLGMLTSPATATPASVCVGGPLADGVDIVCSDYNYGSIRGPADEATVTLNADAELVNVGTNVIGLYGDSNSVTLGADSLASTTGDEYSVLVYGDDNTVTLNGGAKIRLEGYGGTASGKYSGLVSYGDSNSVTLNGGSAVEVFANSDDGSSKYVGIYSRGVDNSVTLNGGSNIVVERRQSGVNDSDIVGVMIFASGVEAGDRSSLTLNGGSSIEVFGAYGGTTNAQSAGVLFGSSDPTAYAPAVTLNGGSSIRVYSANGSSNKYSGIYGGGIDNQVTLNGGSDVTINGYYSEDSKYTGIGVVSGGDYSPEAGAITLNGGSSVNINAFGGSDSKYVGVNVIAVGENKYASDMVLNDSSINIIGSDGEDNKYIGVSSFGNGQTIALNGNSSINLTTNSESNATVLGVVAYGNGVTIALNGSSSIVIDTSESEAGDQAFGIYAFGDNGSITLNGTSSVRLYSSGSNDTAIAGGFEASDFSITLNDDASVYSESGYGIITGGTGTSVTLNGTSSVYGGNAGILMTGGDGHLTIGSDASVTGGLGLDVSGGGNDIHVAGALTGFGPAAISLEGPNNTLTLDSGSVYGDIVSEGSNNDLVLLGEGAFFDNGSGIDDLTVEATGIWNLANSFEADQVTINSGTLAVNGSLYAGEGGVTVNSGGTLGGSGTVYGAVTNYGTISPGNSPGTLNINGSVNFATGSKLVIQIQNGVADLLNVTGAPGTATVATGAVVVPQFLGGVDGFSGDFLTATGGVTGTFSVVNGSIVYTGTTASLTAASPSSINGSVGGASASGFNFLDAVLGQARTGAGRNKGLWGTALWQNDTRSGDGFARGYDQRSTGGAIGGEVFKTGNLSLGLAGGYIDSTVKTSGGGTRTSIDGFNTAVYANYLMGNTFLTGALTAGYQDMDIRRTVLSGATLASATGSTTAWTTGAGIGIGHTIPIQGNWTLTPKANLGWQHVAREAYTETGGGTAGMSIGDVTSDTYRGSAGAELAVTIKAPDSAWAIRPAVSAALAQEWREGDRTASGRFITTGGAFTSTLDTRDNTYAALGAAVDVTFGNGVSAFVAYEGGYGGDNGNSSGVKLGARLEW